MNSWTSPSAASLVSPRLASPHRSPHGSHATLCWVPRVANTLSLLLLFVVRLGRASASFGPPTRAHTPLLQGGERTLNEKEALVVCALRPAPRSRSHRTIHPSSLITKCEKVRSEICYCCCCCCCSCCQDLPQASMAVAEHSTDSQPLREAVTTLTKSCTCRPALHLAELTELTELIHVLSRPTAMLRAIAATFTIS